MTWNFRAVAVGMSIGLSVTTRAQAQVLTPGQCLERLRLSDRHLVRDESGALRDSVAVEQRRRADVARCIDATPVGSTSQAQLLPLAELSLKIGRTQDAQAAVNRRLALSPGLVDRGQLLVRAVKLFASSDDSARTNRALGYLRTLDSLALKSKNDTVSQSRIEALIHMGGYYKAIGAEDSSAQYVGTALKAVQVLSANAKIPLRAQILGLYSRLVEISINRGDVAGARGALSELDREFAPVPEYSEQVQHLLASYALLGKPAPQLHVDDWMTADGKTTQPNLSGRAIVLNFSAHWCEPCRESYPVLKKLSATFKDKPVQLIVATQTYGYFAAQTALTGAQEVALDSGYYFGHYQLPALLAITDQPKKPDAEGRVDPAPSANEKAYGVSAFPQTIVIDPKGIVQAIYLGWDPSNAAHIQDAVNRALAAN